MGSLICPFCLGLAEEADWSEGNRIWEAEHYLRLWEKYQIEGKPPNGKVFED
jgi:hypothetical protein